MVKIIESQFEILPYINLLQGWFLFYNINLAPVLTAGHCFKDTNFNLSGNGAYIHCTIVNISILKYGLKLERINKNLLREDHWAMFKLMLTCITQLQSWFLFYIANVYLFLKNEEYLVRVIVLQNHFQLCWNMALK